MSLWDYLETDSKVQAQFDRSMAELTRFESLWLLDAYNWRQFRTVVDVGGGNGAFLFALLQAVSSLKAILFDKPAVVARATPLLEAAGLVKRCDCVSGSFFDSVPKGFDLYILKRIVYSYDDVNALRVLQRVRAAMRPNSRILLIEPIRRNGTLSIYAELLNMQMLISGGGRVRDRQAMRSLLKSAGLRLTRIVPTPLAAIVEAMP